MPRNTQVHDLISEGLDFPFLELGLPQTPSGYENSIDTPLIARERNVNSVLQMSIKG